MLPRNITISLQVETINFSEVHNNLNGIPSFSRFFQVISCSESYTKLKLDYLIYASGLFLYPLNTSENKMFSDVCRRYRKRPVT